MWLVWLLAGFGVSCGDRTQPTTGSDAWQGAAPEPVVCDPGWVLDGSTCSDLDECAGSPCDENAQCTNLPGSVECACLDGWVGDGSTCADVDECLLEPCAINAACTNLPGAFECVCLHGWTGDGAACSDVDECAVDHPCHANAQWVQIRQTGGSPQEIRRVMVAECC